MNDQKAGVSTTYSYDAGGNITEAIDYPYTTGTLGTPLNNGTKTYDYSDDDWKDLLTSYNGQEISYDNIGNPLLYREGTNGKQIQFTWEGRELKTAVANDKNLSYTYNSDGIRTSKTVDGVTTTYFLDGSTIMAQKSGSDVMWFVYDSDGTRVGFTYNGATYHYTTNAQGDVTGITDVDDNLVVEYSYDAWGKLLNVTDLTGDAHIGQKNPFLYRGYYYDSETGLYYLNSRYYDPQIGRFINADSTEALEVDQGSLVENNLFAYCLNNPVNMSDDEGSIAWWIAAAVGGAIFDTTSYLIGAAISGEKITLAGVGKAALVGAISGVAFGAIGKGIKAVSGAIKASKSVKVASTAKVIVQPIKKIAGKITGYTKHGLAQVMGRDGGRGVKASAVLDTIRNPVQIIKQANGAIKHVGKQAVVVLNEAGKGITAYAKSSKYWR